MQEGAVMGAVLSAAERSGSALAAATPWPWIVAVEYILDERYTSSVRVVQARASDRPCPLGLIPKGARLLRAEVYPATRFDDLPAGRAARERYERHYTAYLMWRNAMAVGKPVAELVPWRDYDPIGIDTAAQRWVDPMRYWGD